MQDSKTYKERISSLMEKVVSVVLDRIDSKVPERGKFTPVSVAFDIPLTNNEGRIIIEPSVQKIEEERRVRIGVCANDSDRMHSYYIFRGTKEKVKEYLTEDEAIQSLVQYCLQLSDAVDNDD